MLGPIFVKNKCFFFGAAGYVRRQDPVLVKKDLFGAAGYVRQFTSLYFSLFDTHLPRPRFPSHTSWTAERFPHEVVCCLPSNSEPPTPENRDKVFRLSPDEIELAFVQKLDKLIASGATDDELVKWRSCALATTYSYQRVDVEDDKHWIALNLRQNLVQDSSTMGFTTLQNIYDVLHEKSKMERSFGEMSAIEVAARYEKNVRYSTESERVSKVEAPLWHIHVISLSSWAQILPPPPPQPRRSEHRKRMSPVCGQLSVPVGPNYSHVCNLVYERFGTASGRLPVSPSALVEGVVHYGLLFQNCLISSWHIMFSTCDRALQRLSLIRLVPSEIAFCPSIA